MKDENPLGLHTKYPDQYDSSLLFPIPRSQSREQLTLLGDVLPFRGEDRWTAYEVSWLDNNGKPQVRIAEFTLDCKSEFIVESKSFKLYLNSFNQTRFASDSDVETLLVTDLSAVAKSTFSVSLLPMQLANDHFVSKPVGIYLDDLDVAVCHYEPEPELLVVASDNEVNEVVFSHLLKTNCPVTDQPDWATVYIEYSGRAIDHSSLLQYIISFRQHQDFHENSVERLYCDINHYCKPDNLTVYARYTRRGGLDINPVRTNYPKGESVLSGKRLRSVRQ